MAITTYGKRHLGAAFGSKTFTEEYVNNKVQKWTTDIINLAGVATTQPHAANAAYIHDLSNHWLYLLQTVPDISDLLQPLEIAIHQHLIPALTGHLPCSSIERALLALPTRLGGLGICNPSAMLSESFQSSEKITAPLVALIVSQDPANTIDPNTMVTLKSDTKKSYNVSKLKPSMISYLLIYKDVWNFLVRKVPHPGSPCSHWKNMVSTCTKENSGMRFA